MIPGTTAYNTHHDFNNTKISYHLVTYLNNSPSRSIKFRIKSIDKYSEEL